MWRAVHFHCAALMGNSLSVHCLLSFLHLAQEASVTARRAHLQGVGGTWAKLSPLSRPAKSIPWKYCIWPGCSLVPSAFLTPAHNRNGCRENWFLIQKPRVAMFPAHTSLFQSWELSWQILWRSAMAINNNMHHQLWWHCQIKTWSWFYHSPQSSLNLNFDVSSFLILFPLYFLLPVPKCWVILLCAGRKALCSPELLAIQRCGNWFM